VWGTSEAQTRVRSVVADQLQRRSECILCYVLKGRRSSQTGQSPDWRSTRGLVIWREPRTDDDGSTDAQGRFACFAHGAKVRWGFAASSNRPIEMEAESATDAEQEDSFSREGA